LSFKVTYKKSVFKDLKNLSSEEAKRILDRLEQELTVNPFSNPELKGEFRKLRKFRIGHYRVVYAVLGNEIRILRIRHRREVYR
jgi:mRNA interferase RelE/StbE